MTLAPAATVPALAWPSNVVDNTAAAHESRVVIARHCAARIAKLAPRLRVCVQAGGHVGLWPQALSRYFETVYTFEPDAANWACLVQNATAPNIFAARGVLGSRAEGMTLRNDTGKSGMWYAVPGGPIPTYTVDALGLPALDALVLDVEGAELPALMGAEFTITKHRPLVWFEAHEHGARRGGSTTDVIAWLLSHDYNEPRTAFGRDLYMRPRA